LGIFDATIKFGNLPQNGLMRTIANGIPKYVRDRFTRFKIPLEMKWEVEVVDGKANYIFIPNDKLAWAFRAKGDALWFKIYLDTKNEFEKLKCPVVPIFVYSDEFTEQQTSSNNPT